MVTQDIGLAAMALGRHARAIGVRGRVYTLTTIDLDMHIRHEEKKVRRQGGRTKGPAASKTTIASASPRTSSAS